MDWDCSGEQICSRLKSCQVIVLPRVSWNYACEVVFREDKLRECLKVSRALRYDAAQAVLPEVED
jgi:hypothetical protein